MNENLIQENKRLIEVFPEGVLIQKPASDANYQLCWSNKKFNRHICKLQNTINQLKDFKIKFHGDDREGSEDAFNRSHHNLYELIKFQEKEVDQSQSFEQHNVEIECFESLDESEESKLDNEIKKVSKIYGVKTIKISWDGDSNAYMHVFVDMTNIVKLEQVNNDIKCQKIMFASTSHEFRTPLNAILNSYKFIDSRFATMCDRLVRSVLSHSNVTRI